MCSPTALSQRMQQGYPSGRGVGGPWRPVLTTGQHAGRLLGGSGKAPQDAKFISRAGWILDGAAFMVRVGGYRYLHASFGLLSACSAVQVLTLMQGIFAW